MVLFPFNNKTAESRPKQKKMQKPEPLTWSRTVEKWGQRWEMHSRYDPEDPELKGQLPSVMISWSSATSRVAHCTQASHETSPPKTALLHSPWKPSNHKNRKFIDKIMFRMLPPTHFPLHLDEHRGEKACSARAPAEFNLVQLMLLTVALLCRS